MRLFEKISKENPTKKGTLADLTPEMRDQIERDFEDQIPPEETAIDLGIDPQLIYRFRRKLSHEATKQKIREATIDPAKQQQINLEAKKLEIEIMKLQQQQALEGQKMQMQILEIQQRMEQARLEHEATMAEIQADMPEDGGVFAGADQLFADLISKVLGPKNEPAPMFIPAAPPLEAQGVKEAAAASAPPTAAAAPEQIELSDQEIEQFVTLVPKQTRALAKLANEEQIKVSIKEKIKLAERLTPGSLQKLADAIKRG